MSTPKCSNSHSTGRRPLHATDVADRTVRAAERDPEASLDTLEGRSDQLEERVSVFLWWD